MVGRERSRTHALVEKSRGRSSWCGGLSVVSLYISSHAWVGWVIEIKYEPIAAARGAFTSWRSISLALRQYVICAVYKYTFIQKSNCVFSSPTKRRIWRFYFERRTNGRTKCSVPQKTFAGVAIFEMPENFRRFPFNQGINFTEFRGKVSRKSNNCWISEERRNRKFRKFWKSNGMEIPSKTEFL